MPVLEKYFGRIPAGPNPEPMATSSLHKSRRRPSSSKCRASHSISRAITGRLPRPRRCRLRRHSGYFLQRPHLTALPQPGARPADCRGGRRFQRFPGDKYPGLSPSSPHRIPAILRADADAIHKEIDKLKTTDVTDEDWQCSRPAPRRPAARPGRQPRACQTACDYQLRYGDWRELFKQLEED